MIYLFNQDKTLYTDYPIIPEDLILSLPERRQINGLWTVSADLLVEGLYHHVNDSAYIGFYDADNRFQLYKIIDLQVNNDIFTVDAVYLFHDEAYSGEVIRDRRFINRQADAAAIAAFEPIGWTLDGYDFTDERTTNFYYISPLEALARIEEVWGVEFNFWIVFDGQKILGKYYEMRKQIGKFGNMIYEYNENISNITHTQSRQDIVTAVLPRGRGEELEEGVFGRSIQIDDVVWSKASGDPLDKPAGQDYLEIPEATAIWGYDGVKPRIRKVDFSNEEDPENLIKLAHEWLLENSVPKSVFKLQVADGQSHDLGDTVGVSYKAIGLTSYTRVFEVERDHKTGRVIVEFGDVELKSDRRISAIRSDIERIESNNSRVVELQQQFNSMFDAKVREMEQEYEQALIDAYAEIAAIDANMKAEIESEIASFEDAFNSEVQAAKDLAQQQIADTEQRINEEIDTTRTEMESEFNAEVQAAKDLAQQQIADSEQRINTTLDTARGEIEHDYNQAVASAREYAEQQAEQQANAVDSKLETMRGDHAGLIQQNTDNIANVNDFLGPRDRTLQIILDEQRAELEQKIEVYSRSYPNLQVGTTFENIQGWRAWQGRHGELELRTNESLNFVRVYPNGSNSPAMESLESITLESDKHYVIAVDFRSDDVQDLDNSYFLSSSGNITLSTTQTRGLTADGAWHRYYFDIDMTGRASGDYRLMLGSSFNYGDTTIGTFDLRQIHVYEGTTHGIPWTPSPSDNSQIVSQILYEIRELEDGMSSLATKTELNVVTGNLTQLTNEYTSTSAQVSSKLQSFDDLLGDNGSHFTQVADQVQSKVWLNDIHNPNLLSYTDVHLFSERQRWGRWNVSITGSAYSDEFMWIRNTDSAGTIGIISPTLKIEAGRTYTLSWVGLGNDNMNMGMNYCYVMYDNNSNRALALPSRTVIPTSPSQYGGRTVYRYRLTFTGHYSDTAEVMIGGYTQGSGLDVSFFVKEPKLELGERATSYYTAFSGITQRISEIELLTQEIDGGVLRQSDITVSPSSVRIGSTEILGDDVLASVLNVSPSAIDIITQKMRLSGDLYVDGDITTLAIEAVEGNFASLIVANLETNKLRARHINALAIGADHLLVDNALIDKLSASSIFTDMLTTKTISAVEGNFGELIVANLETNKLRARHINANAIGADHLYVTNAMIEKLVANSILTDEMTARSVSAINANFGTLFASAISTVDLNASNIKTGTLSSERLQVNNALINRLISNSILTSEMRAQSLTAVRGDIADLRTRILTSDVITSTHISSSNALIDKLFASSALISRLTSKSAFISQIQTIDLEAAQVRVGFNGISNNVTINSSGITIDSGALTVNRTDGGAPTIISGSNPNGVHLVASTPNRRDSGFTTQGQYAVRPAGGSYMIYDFYMFEWFYSDLMLDFAILNTTSSEIRVRMHVRGTDGSTFSREVDYTIPANTAIFPRMIVNLGVPDGSTQRFFIEARNVGTSSNFGSFGIHTYMVKHLDNGADYPRLEFS